MSNSIKAAVVELSPAQKKLVGTDSTSRQQLTGQKQCECAPAAKYDKEDGLYRYSDCMYRVANAKGLYLRVRSDKSKFWVYRYTNQAKKMQKLTIGEFPSMGFAAACEEAAKCTVQKSQGTDPRDARQAIAAEFNKKSAETVKAVCAEWLKSMKHKHAESTRRNTISQFETRLYPVIGDKHIGSLTQREIKSVFNEMNDCSYGTQKLLLKRLNAVLNYAMDMEIIPFGRTPKADRMITKPKEEKNQAAMETNQLTELVSGIESANLDAQTEVMLKLQLHTMTRPTETSAAEWSEFNFDKKVWTIPAGRMKTKREHVIPLTQQVIDMLVPLKEASRFTKSEYLFPSAATPTKPVDKTKANYSLKRIFGAGVQTAHGFRAVASTTLNSAGFDSDVVEYALAHSLGNDVKHRYDRTDLAPLHAATLEWWSSRIEQAARGEIEPLSKAIGETCLAGVVNG